jgi:hypothetical protein
MSKTGKVVANVLKVVALSIAGACSAAGTTAADAGLDAQPSNDSGVDAQGGACTVPSDCVAFPGGPAIACCIHNACLYAEAAEAQTCGDASAQTITATSYDQTCQKDSDCVAIEEGNFCLPGANNGCTNAAINKGALAQYRADLAKTQGGVCYGVTGCPEEGAPCCASGKCTADPQCKTTSGDASVDAEAGQADGGRVPLNHRPNDALCLGGASAGNCPGGDSGAFACQKDGDCTAGTNGRCREFGGPVGCFCSYDTCAKDADCPTGQTCACHGSPYNEASNTCVPGNCRVDADCGPGFSCSPTVPEGGWCGNVGGYYCHTPADSCLDDSDCATAGNRFCAYSTTDARWTCQDVPICQ